MAVIFGPLIILFSYWGGWWLAGMILFFGLLGSGEYIFRIKIKPIAVFSPLTLIAAGLIIYLAIFQSFLYGIFILIGYFLVAGLILALRHQEPKELFEAHMKLVWGTVYIGFLWPFVYLIRNVSFDRGGDYLLLLFGTLWLSDTLAMFGGKAFGKRKLAPTVSPNKTVAGFISGLCGGIIIGGILSFWRLEMIPVYHLLISGVLISFAGQIGDLVESMWKRAVGIKDSSGIIPGHGGILDRFDSLLFAAPVLYLYLSIFITNIH